MRPRRAAAWLLSLPLMIAGTQVAHVLAYQFVYPSAHVRLTALLSSGHGYMVGTRGYLPMLLALTGALDLLAAGWVLVGTVRRSLQRPVPAWAFGLLPILCFTLQESLERWLAGSSFPWWIVLQPTFRIGLLLQLPFAILAAVAGRMLLRAAHRTADRLRREAPRLLRFGCSPTWVAVPCGLSPRAPRLAARLSRGPPRVAVAPAAS